MSIGFCTEYEITGRNLALLFQKLDLKKIPFKNLYKTQDGVRISIDGKYNEQFLSILNQSWSYKTVSVSGKKIRLKKALKNAGIFIGILIFLLGTFFTDNILFSIKYSGDCSYFYRDIQAVLERNSVKKYSRFSSIDLRDLSEQIYAENPLICYSSVKKEGNFLVVEVKKSQNYTYGVDTTQKELKSTVDGRILQIKVYRGVALKKVGDEVKAGEVIVSGERVDEDKIYQGYVLATVSVLKSYEYTEQGEDSLEALARATARAKALCGAEEYYFEQTTCENGKILVKLEYVIILGG